MKQLSFLKRCPCCMDEYPATLDNFQSDKQKRDGLSAYCKPCAHRKRKERDRTEHSKAVRRNYYQKNYDKYAQRNREQYEKHKDKRQSSVRDYHNRNKVSVAAYKQQWAEQNRERTRAAAKRFSERHPDRVRVSTLIQIGKRKGAKGRYTSGDVRRIYIEQQGYCAYCNEWLGDKYHIDHIIPLSRGGSNYPENIALACPPCNMSKGDKLLSEWKRRLP